MFTFDPEPDPKWEREHKSRLDRARDQAVWALVAGLEVVDRAVKVGEHAYEFAKWGLSIIRESRRMR